MRSRRPSPQDSISRSTATVTRLPPPQGPITSGGHAVPKRSLAAVLLAAFVLVLGVVAAGCGGDDNDSSSNGTGSSSSTGQSGTGKQIKVGLVTDIGGLKDRSFN